MVERIAELVREKKIEGIADLRDESDRDGFRVVVELKRDAVPDVVLNQLYRFTPLQTNFGANMVALDSRPAAVDEPEGPADAVRRLPRTGGDAAHQVPAQQGARPRPYPGRSRHRGRQYRRGDPRDPDLARSQHRARNPDVARLVGQGRRGDDDADRRSASSACRGRHRPAVDGTGEGHPRPAPAAADRARPRGNLRRARQAGAGDQRLSGHPALPRPGPGDHQDRACGGQIRIRHPAQDRHHRAGRRGRRRGPDPARRHGGHGFACRLRQARAAVGLSCPAPRRQGPGGDADPRRGFRQPAVRGLDPYPGAVLLLARPGVQGKGVAAADRGAERARQGADQYPAAGAGRADHHHHAAARGRIRPGAIST